MAWEDVGCQQGGYYKCKPCKRYDSLVARGMREATPEAQEAWKNTSKEERKLFKADILAESGISQAAFNAKLATVTLTSEASTRNRSLSKTKCQYFDSPDLAKKYGGKPEQLQTCARTH